MTLVALVLLLASAAGQALPEPQSPASLARQLYLRVSTHSGRQPLELNLMGELRGIDPAEMESCTIRVDRFSVTPLEKRLEERVEHPCIAGTVPGIPTLPTFKRKLILQEPGDYVLRIVLQPRERPPIAGMTHEVKVYKAPVEIKIPEIRN